MNDGNNVMLDDGPGDLVNTNFGWGSALMDFNNDGNTDILFHGGMNTFALFVDNPGVCFFGDGEGDFDYDPDAVSDTNHLPKETHGVAVGDLNQVQYYGFLKTHQSFATKLLTFRRYCRSSPIC